MTNESIPAYEPGDALTVTVGAGGVVGKTFVDISAALNPATGTPATAVTATAAGLSIGVASRDVAVRGEVWIGANVRAVTLAAGKARRRAWSAGSSGNDVFIELY